MFFLISPRDSAWVGDMIEASAKVIAVRDLRHGQSECLTGTPGTHTPKGAFDNSAMPMNSAVRLIIIMAVPTTGTPRAITPHHRHDVGRAAQTQTLPMNAPRSPNVARRYGGG
jgi:hypothetical protein